MFGIASAPTLITVTHHPDPRVDEVLSRFDIRVDEYTPQALVTALRGSWDPPSDGRFVEVLLRPAFHPELLLVLHERPDGTVLWASTAQTNLFSWRRSNPLHPNHNPDEHPALVTATVWPNAETADHIWELADDVIQPDPRPGIGLDGVSVDLRIRLGGDLLHVQTWCPPADTPVGELLEAFGRLATEMPIPFPAIASAAEIVRAGIQVKEYVGMVWVGEEAGKRVRLLAATSAEAGEMLRQQYGQAIHCSLHNEDDANRLRR
jgi:hypothetical protein